MAPEDPRRSRQLAERPAPPAGQARGFSRPAPHLAHPAPGRRSRASAHRRPSQRDVARADEHGAEVVVKDHDGPVEEHDEVDAPAGSVQGPVPQGGVGHGSGGAHGHHSQGHQRPPVAQPPCSAQPSRPLHGCYRRPPAAAQPPPMAPATLSPAPSRRMPREKERCEEREGEAPAPPDLGPAPPARRGGRSGAHTSPRPPAPPGPRSPAVRLQ